MEEEKAADNIQSKSSSPLSTGLPINWGLITGPVPVAVFPAPSLNASLPPPQSSAVHTLQTKVKSLTQRRARGRDREKNTEMLVSSPAGQISSEVILRQRPRGKAQQSLSAHSWRSGVVKDLSSSDEEEEVEVQVRLEIHSPPAEVKAERWREEIEGERSETNEGQVQTEQLCGLREGTSLESLLSDNSSSSKDDPSPRPLPVLTTSPTGTSASTTLSYSSPLPPLPVLSTSPVTTSSAPTTSSLLSTRPLPPVLSTSPSSVSSPVPTPPVLSCSPASTSAPTTVSFTSSTSSSARHWAPPRGFWRVARPETLLLNGVGPNTIPSTVPLKDSTQTEAVAEPQRKQKPSETGNRNTAESVDDYDAASEFKHSDSVECYLDRCEQKELDLADATAGLCSSDSWESTSSQSGALCAYEKLKVKERAYAKLRERRRNCREEREQSGGESDGFCGDTTDRVYHKVAGAHGVSDNSDSAILAQELEPYLRALLITSDDLPLSPRHEQAKRLLERARLKARSNHTKGERPFRRSHSDQRSTVKKQQTESPGPTTVQKAVQTSEELPAQTGSGPLLVPAQRETSPTDQGGRPRRYGCSPTRVRFEDESEKDAESRYLDRVRQRGRPGVPKSKSKESNTDSSSSGSERGRSHRSGSMPPSQKQEDGGVSGETLTVVKEIIVLVKKCEACGSVVREPQPASYTPDVQNTEPQQSGNPEDSRGKPSPRWVPPNKPEASTRPKAPLTVTFAGAYVLGENKESSGWKSSGFGKLRRRSRKGESRLESGHGPYGPSWAQRRNSNPRNRVNLSRAVSFAPGSPVDLEPNLLEASGGLRESPAPSLPIKSALKSSSRNRSAAGSSTVQFQVPSNHGGDSGSQPLVDTAETRREPPVSSQGAAATSSAVPCIRPSTLRYSPARLTTDLPAAELWDSTPDGAGLSGDIVPGAECRALRGLAMSRAEDLRAELLRAEHLKAEAVWEESSDGSRKLDGRPKLFLRRFFSSIGLNSVGRLVKGSRSSSMEQLSIPTVPRASSASPSPTRKSQPSIRIQRTPSLQTLHTVLPLAQLRKASSVQSLERRERSTILGEVQIPYGLAPSPETPQLELHRALSVEDVLTTRIVRPVGRAVQAFPDGSILLELIKPPNGPFGFVISRGKGRPDTGVYVEKVGDGSGEGPYVGLLGIGDEILQVNGEAVAGLSLDQVTRLMTRESTASLRIMPARRNQR
ncbi:flocculation protein FLO11 isoform X2 [Mugil cephalus]|uniref:flocculation protein FLO11 isoform X2 n=1 Tax=Mugil cephalus TaxID=48193 RepID=UPI001FB59E8B|nr:flocculation protein FLO11 isoform X2 [Mugil cephalus]